jgi:lysophospholipase L1-like esterase
MSTGCLGSGPSSWASRCLLRDPGHAHFWAGSRRCPDQDRPLSSTDVPSARLLGSDAEQTSAHGDRRIRESGRGTHVSYAQMVALGSSFAAGPQLKPVLDRGAMRSGRNYPHLVAARLGATLVDATVSGATTSTILEQSQKVMRRVYPPQIESVHADADLVTVTAGGNDLGYIGGVMSTAVLGAAGRWPLVGRVASRVRSRRELRPVPPEQQEAATDGLVRVVAGIRRRAPRARVVLVDYLPVFTDASVTGPEVPLTTGELEHFRGVAGSLSTAYAEASRRSGADLVPASTYDPGHAAGSEVPWVNGLRLRALPSSFHPTLAGMQAVADAVLGRLSDE